MKKIAVLICLTWMSIGALAQEVDYKKGVIYVDDQEYAKVEVKKENFGLTKNFEVYSMSGKKLIIATVATEFEQDKSDNTYLFYKLTFLTSNQVGIFKVPSLSQEKGFAKLIGKSGVIKGDATEDEKVKEFIASKGASPRIAVDYTTVNRNRAWPIDLRPGGNIEQNDKVIGQFKPKGSSGERDFYEFTLPSGVIVAKVNFTGGNFAQNMEVFTSKDNRKQIIPIPTGDKIIAADFSIDKNQFALKRVVKWLVDNQYL